MTKHTEDSERDKITVSTNGEEGGYNKVEIWDREIKTSPYLVSWADMQDIVKQVDREAVRSIPQILENGGFELYK